MAVKMSAVNTEIGIRDLLEEIVSSLSPDYYVSDVKSLVSDYLKENDVEATVKETVEAVNLGVKEGMLQIGIVPGDGHWMITKVV